jgi:hypothetical protein
MKMKLDDPSLISTPAEPLGSFSDEKDPAVLADAFTAAWRHATESERLEGRPFQDVRDLAVLTPTVQATVDLLRDENHRNVMSPHWLIDHLNRTHPSLWAERRYLTIIRGDVVLTNLSGESKRPANIEARKSLEALRNLDKETQTSVKTDVEVARLSGRYSDWLSVASSWEAAQKRGDSGAALRCAYVYMWMKWQREYIDLTMDRAEHLNDTFRGETIRSYIARQTMPALIAAKGDPHNTGPLFPKLTEQEASCIVEYATCMKKGERTRTTKAAISIAGQMAYDGYELSDYRTILPSKVLNEWRKAFAEEPDPDDWADTDEGATQTAYAALYLHSLIAPTHLTHSTVDDQVDIPLNPWPLHTVDPSLAHLADETNPAKFVHAMDTLTSSQRDHVHASTSKLIDRLDYSLRSTEKDIYDLWHSAIAREEGQRRHNAACVEARRGDVVAVDEVDHFAWAGLLNDLAYHTTEGTRQRAWGSPVT